MGLLSALRRRVGRFAEGAGEAMGDRLSRATGHSEYMPVTSSLVGAMGGAMLGAAAPGDDGSSNAMMGAGIGAALGGGRSLARLLGSGLMGGLREVAMTAPESGVVFMQMKTQLASAMRRATEEADIPPLMRQMVIRDTQAAMERLMRANNRTELMQVLDELGRDGGGYLPRSELDSARYQFR